MKVKELQEILNQFDPELPVICHSEDENLSSGKPLFEIEDIMTVVAERIRLGDGSPQLKFERGRNSETLVVLDITSDF